MQYKKLTGGQRKIKRWRARRARILLRILDGDKRISRVEAERQASRAAGPVPGRRADETGGGRGRRQAKERGDYYRARTATNGHPQPQKETEG